MQKALSWNELKGIKEQTGSQSGQNARPQGSWKELLGPRRNSGFSLSVVGSDERE